MGRAAQVLGQKEVTRRRPAGKDLGIDQPFLVPCGDIGQAVAIAFLGVGMHDHAVLRRRSRGRCPTPTNGRPTASEGGSLLPTGARSRGFRPSCRCRWDPGHGRRPAHHGIRPRSAAAPAPVCPANPDGYTRHVRICRPADTGCSNSCRHRTRSPLAGPGAIPEGLDVGRVFLDQVVQRHEGALGPELVDGLLDRGAANDVGQVALRNQQVHGLAAVGAVLAGSRVGQTDVGQLASHLLGRVGPRWYRRQRRSPAHVPSGNGSSFPSACRRSSYRPGQRPEP